MATCKQTNIPELNQGSDPCEGERKSTDCVVHPNAIPSLNLPPESNQTEINSALIAALQTALIRIQNLEDNGM